MTTKGFYAESDHAIWNVFAFDEGEYDAVWITICDNDLLDDVPEEAWELPSEPGELTEWLAEYGYKKITPVQARPHIGRYLDNLRERLNPEGLEEIVKDPNKVIAFIRLVQQFSEELDEL